MSIGVTGLSKKQKCFVEEYLRCWNASKAAAAAGYANPDKQASRVLKNEKVSAEIQFRLEQAAMSADEVLARLAEQGRAEYAAYIQPDLTIDVEQMIADGKAHLIAGITNGKFGTDVKFHNAQAALIQLGRHHKLFTDRLAGGGDDDELVVKVIRENRGGDPSTHP